MNSIENEKLAYVCSPYRGNIIKRIRNVRYARKLTKQAIAEGYIPITPHLFLTQVLNDRKPIERAKGLALGESILKTCEVVLVGEKYGISEGMKSEISMAEKYGKKIIRLQDVIVIGCSGIGRVYHP